MIKCCTVKWCFDLWQHLPLCFKCINAHNTDASAWSCFHSSAKSEAWCRKLLPCFWSWIRRQLLLWERGMNTCLQETKLLKRESRSDVYTVFGTLCEWLFYLSYKNEDSFYIFKWTCTQQIEEELNHAYVNLQTAREQIGDLNLQGTILTSGEKLFWSFHSFSFQIVEWTVKIFFFISLWNC